MSTTPSATSWQRSRRGAATDQAPVAGVWWVAWRQQRFQVLCSVGVLVALVIGLLALYLVMNVAITGLGIEGCKAVDNGRCGAVPMGQLSERFGRALSLISLILLALPPLLGALGGGPLFAREHENGTHVLALTQSVTVTRWWLVKCAVAAAPVSLVLLAVGLVSTAAFGVMPFGSSGPLMTPGFETRGLVPVAYFLLAFTFAASAGIFIHNTAAVIGASIAAYTAILLVTGGLLRPHYLPPEHITSPVTAVVQKAGQQASPPAPDDWIIESHFVDASDSDVVFRASQCTSTKNLVDCLVEQGIAAEAFVYQPASRYWALQSIETGTIVGLSGLILLVGLSRLRRRVI